MDDVTNVDPARQNDLSVLAVTLLKGVLYRESDEKLWSSLLDLQARLRDYMAVLQLELALDEAEGYAYLRSRAGSDDEDQSRVPRLIARRALSFNVSLLLALLRKKLAEFDARGGSRLVMARDEIVQMLALFLATGTNESRIVDQIDTHIGKIVELGFLRPLKSTGSAPSYEVRRILKAFVDGQWLADFDNRLAAYRARLSPDSEESSDV